MSLSSSTSSGSTGRKRASQASQADRYALYLQSVQAPDVDVKFFQRIYQSNYKKPARSLREDFCGTAAICAEWVKLHRDMRAYGVDLDPAPLVWGEEHILSQLKPVQRGRVSLVEGDVRTAKTPRVDILAAQNFSYCIFKTRDELRKYFEYARGNLKSQGVFVLDLFGGYESIEDNREESTEHRDFDYVWEQEKFDPITHHARYHIHFRFRDGSALKRIFSYDWRLWTLPEVCEVLQEAGFKESHVYWEDADKDTGDGNGVFRKRAHGESDPPWNAYIVGVK